MIGSILSFMPMSYAQGGAGNDILIGGRGNDFSNEEPSAIPDWVKTQFAWYVSGEIDEATLLTSMNWMFDNNLMHLSEGAAQEVNDLRTKVAEQEAAISTLRTLVSSQAMSDESGKFWFEDLQPGYSEDALNHLRKAYDLNPNDVAVVMQHDANHDKWIPVLQVQWGSGDEVIIEDITGKPLAETFVFTHLLENSEYSSSGSTETGSWDTEMVSMGAQASNSTGNSQVLTYTGLEFAATTVDLIMKKGGTTTAWDEGMESFSSQGMSESVTEELQKIVVLCNIEIDKKTQQIDSELELIEQWLKIIEENQETSSYDAAGRLTSTTDVTQYNQSDLEFIGNKLSSIDQQIKALSNGVTVLEGKVQGMDESDATSQANSDMILKGKKILQNLVEEQRQQIDDLSKASKIHHDTMMSIINNMR